jgi:hypothetical protein
MWKLWGSKLRAVSVISQNVALQATNVEGYSLLHN